MFFTLKVLALSVLPIFMSANADGVTASPAVQLQAASEAQPASQDTRYHWKGYYTEPLLKS